VYGTNVLEIGERKQFSIIIAEEDQILRLKGVLVKPSMIEQS